MLLSVATGLAITAFLFAGSAWTFTLAACFYATGQCGVSAVRQALPASVAEPSRRTRIRVHLQSAGNAGPAVGAGLGGLALLADTPGAYVAAFSLDAAAFGVSAVLLRLLPAVASVPWVEGEPALAVLRDRPYALVTLLNVVLLLRMPLSSVAIPLWIVSRTAAPEWTVSALFVLNTIVVVLGQVRAATRVTGLPSATRLVRHSGVLLAASCVAFALSATGSSAPVALAVLVAGALLQVLGEMLQSAGTWEIGFGLAPAARQGQYQGFFGTSTSVARMAGPALLSTVVMQWAPPAAYWWVRCSWPLGGRWVPPSGGPGSGAELLRRCGGPRRAPSGA